MKIKDDRFNRNYEEDPDTGCWDWQASKTKDGYGQLFHTYYNILKKETRKCSAAHRYSWRLHMGPIPPELEVGHRCDNPGCVNPDHLWLATHEENIRDSVQKGRWMGAGNQRGAPGRSRAPRPNIWMRALQPHEVREIRILKKHGYTYREIAKKYPVGKTAISNIHLGLTYKDIPD